MNSNFMEKKDACTATTDDLVEMHLLVGHPKFCCYKAKVRTVIKILFDAAIPIMIGIVTLVIAIHQQNVSQSNRDKDTALAAEFRKQDLELARLQRREDIDNARRQREEDKEMTRLQRGLDSEMASDKRLQDYEISERHRNLSESHRTQEQHMARENYVNDLILEEERQQENVLLEYQDDLTALLLNYSDLFNKYNAAPWFTLQMKTGAALRRLDPTRRTRLLHLLLEGHLLNANTSNEQSLLYMANASGVDFGYTKDYNPASDYIQYNYFRMASADLRYATFRKIYLEKSPYFDFSELDYTHWSSVLLPNVHFRGHITMNSAIFSNCTLIGTIFGENTKLNRISFQHNVTCISCRFVHSSLLGARLDHSNFLQSKFASLSMADSNMSNGSFVASTFEELSLDRANLSGANFRRCTFFRVSMLNCSLFGTVLEQTAFKHVNMTGCVGLIFSQFLSNVNLSNTTLPNGTFVEQAMLK